MAGDEARQSAQRLILIVEDNELNLKLLKDVIEYHGYATVVTGFGETAIDLAHQDQPDLILLDMQLADISGLDVARRLKADPQTKAIPIVAVTAFAMSGDREKILESGCNDYVAKPFRILEVLELIAGYIGAPPAAEPTR
jgi:two-component system, cell cycle response regulator DivK